MAKFVCDYIHDYSIDDKCGNYEPGGVTDFRCDCKHLNLVYCNCEIEIANMLNSIRRKEVKHNG